MNHLPALDATSRARSVLVRACAVGAMCVAFAVGAPWLLREAPPDMYAVVAAQAACAAWDDAHSDCRPALP